MNINIDEWDLCCGAPLKKGAKFIAVIDMAMAGAKMCFAGFALVLMLLFGSEIKDAVDRDQAQFPDQAQVVDDIGIGGVALFMLMLFSISGLYFMLARYLLHGAQEMDISKINTWFRITVILFGIRGMFYFIGMLSGSDFAAAFALTGLIGLSYSAYCLLVVYQFRKQLMSEESNVLKGAYYYSSNPLTL